MEATVVSVGKAVLDGALSYAKSKAAEEIALQLDVEGDVNFITDELQMMQSFLMTADEERGKNMVLTTWVKQIRDVAYKVEDSLMDFALHTEKKPFWGCIPRSSCDRRRIAKEVKDLRTKVEDVSNRNLRYRLIKDSSSPKPTTIEEQANIASAAMFGINEAKLAAVEHEDSKVDLLRLISSEEEDLRVIAVWGTTGDLGKTSAIQEVYDDPIISSKFGFRAWIKLMHPFNPEEFICSLVGQFYENCPEKLEETHKKKSAGVSVLMKMKSMEQSDMINVFDTQVSDNSYLIVIDDLFTIVEWHCIKMFFSNNKKRSRIIVSTQQVEVASLCTEKPYQVSEIKQLSSDQTLYLFHKKVISASGSVKDTSVENNRTMPTPEIQQEGQQPTDTDAGEDEVPKSTDPNELRRKRTTALVDELFTGRQAETSKVIGLIGQPEHEQGRKVISVWGMGGLGKTTLVKSVYRSQQLSCWKLAWATALRPFNPRELIEILVLQLLRNDIDAATQKKCALKMNLQQLKVELSRLLKTHQCLIVLDDISSTSEWEFIQSCLENAKRVIVTTREKSVAKHCSQEDKNMYNLCRLEDDTALDLFKKKVFKDIDGKIDLHPDMMEQAIRILKKCDGLPLAISTIGGFLATKPRTATEWRNMNDRISAELDVNPELSIIKTILMRSYDGLPYHLKSCFLYMSIFPEDYIIWRDHLVRRWIVEGYSRDIHGMTAEEVGHRYFDELLDRSMILPGKGVDYYNGKINFCQLHDIMREICISKAREENLVFALEEGCCLSSTQGPVRHLVIRSNWKRDKDVFESMLDTSHVRSLTVFGEWEPYFISDNMRFLRVLDLKDTSKLTGGDLHKIGRLFHLKYLCVPHNVEGGLYLPKSVRNCRHLQTLDAGRLIVAPRGIGKLHALHTLRLVDVAQGKGNVIIKEIGKLTQLRSLQVCGVSYKNSKDFWSAIAGHSQLQFLQACADFDTLDDFDDLSTPKCLERLVLHGKLVRATKWIDQLQNLSNLVLTCSQLGQDAIQALGMLPNLAVLDLLSSSYVGRELHFQESSSSSSSSLFPSLVMLQLSWIDSVESVLFEQHTMPKLELLQVDNCHRLKEISELSVLTSLKEIRLNGTSKEVMEGVQRQVAEHRKHVSLDMYQLQFQDDPNACSIM